MMKFGLITGLRDVPNNRSSHKKIVPRGAGIGTLLSFILCAVWLDLPLFLTIPVIAVSISSFWGGDKERFSAKERLLIQCGCSLCFIFGLFYSLPHGEQFFYMVLPVMIFVVGTANFYNFMDGIDGIAGITGIVAFLLVSFYGCISNADPVYLELGFGIAFSCAGFLFFNIPKAKVFLGDIGSVLLGFVFSCIVILLSKSLVDFFVMAGSLSVFYWDELLTMAVRIKNGDSLLKPHRKHVYQLLANELEIKHWKISVSYGLIQLLVGISMIFLRHMGLELIIALYALYGLIFGGFSFFVRRKVDQI